MGALELDDEVLCGFVTTRLFFFFFYIIIALTRPHALYVFSIEHIIDIDTINCAFLWLGEVCHIKIQAKYVKQPLSCSQKAQPGSCRTGV